LELRPVSGIETYRLNSETPVFFPLWYLLRRGIRAVEKCKVHCMCSEGRPAFSHNETTDPLKVIAKWSSSVAADRFPATICCTQTRGEVQGALHVRTIKASPHFFMTRS